MNLKDRAQRVIRLQTEYDTLAGQLANEKAALGAEMEEIKQNRLRVGHFVIENNPRWVGVKGDNIKIHRIHNLGEWSIDKGNDSE